MPSISIPFAFTPNTVAASSQVNANFNAIATFFNSTKLDSTNLQSGAVVTATLADGAVTGVKLNSDVVDGTTVVLTSNQLSVPTGGIALAQLATALQNALVPAGSILPFGGSSAPGGFVLCDGSLYARSGTYASLFSAIGVNFGGGDGSTTFAVPDLRGVFLRGVDGSRGADPDSSSRTNSATQGGTSNTGDLIGSYQDQAFQTHTHSFSPALTFNSQQYSNGGSGPAPNNTNTSMSTGSPNSGTVSSETRPKNVYVQYIIKY